MNISVLVGLTLTRVAMSDREKITFESTDGRSFVMYHSQDCCESVSIDDVNGDLSDLVDTPILSAEEVSSANESAKDTWDDSYTWTFYRLATIKGSVCIRWYGTSNGYYSERVDFEETKSGSAK